MALVLLPKCTIIICRPIPKSILLIYLYYKLEIADQAKEINAEDETRLNTACFPKEQKRLQTIIASINHISVQCLSVQITVILGQCKKTTNRYTVDHQQMDCCNRLKRMIANTYICTIPRRTTEKLMQSVVYKIPVVFYRTSTDFSREESVKYFFVGKPSVLPEVLLSWCYYVVKRKM